MNVLVAPIELAKVNLHPPIAPTDGALLAAKRVEFGEVECKECPRLMQCRTQA